MGKKGRRAAIEHPKIRKTLGENVKLIMEAKGVISREVANEKMDRTTIDRLKRGAYGTTLDNIGHLADALGVSFEKLFLDRETGVTGKEKPLFPSNNYNSAERKSSKKKRND